MGLRDLYVVTFLGEEKPMVLNNEDNLLASVAAPIQEVIVATSCYRERSSTDNFKRSNI